MKARFYLFILILTCTSFTQTTQAAGSSPDGQTVTAEDYQKTESLVENLQEELSEAKDKVARLEAKLSAAQQSLVQLEGEVTARQDLSEPLAITRLFEADMERGGIQDITRIAQQVPGMQFGYSGNEARIAIRGSRTTRTGPESEQVVGIYEDGVPVATTTQALGPYIDIKQIEVLRGPQGVMYGRNAFGGVINVTSNKPDPDGWDAALKGTIGFSDHTRFEAMLNIPVLDTLAVRLVGSGETYSGYVNNYVLESDADDLKTRIQQYVRVMTRWAPTENFSLQLNLASLDQNGTGSGMWGYMQDGAYINGQYQPGHQFAPSGASADYGPWDVARNMASLTELENLSTSLLLSWNLGFATLEWQASKSKFESMQVFDGDYSNGGNSFNSDFNGWNSFMDTLSSDLRLKSDKQGRFDWLAGLHVLSIETDWGWLETIDSVQLRPQWDSTGLYTTDSSAMYASGGFRASDSIRVFGGLRWYEDEKQLRNDATGSWDGVVWNAGLEYSLNPDTMSYLSASTGYRPGGINEIPGVPERYDSENVTAYEIGLKTLLANNSITLKLSAFLNDYEDMQAQSFTLLPLAGTAGLMDYLSTAGDMESKGIEAEFQWLPDSHWNVSAYISWLDAQFNNYNVANLAGLGDIEGHTTDDGLSLDGWQPAFSPEWSLGLQASYLINIGRWGTFTPMIQTSFISEFYANDLNLEGALQESHSVTDLRLFWDFPGDSVRVQVFIENATDERSLRNTMIYNPAERPEIATFLNDWGDPRKYGLILSYRY
jgi:iron complex outermembrane receptor protein